MFTHQPIEIENEIVGVLIHDGKVRRFRSKVRAFDALDGTIFATRFAALRAAQLFAPSSRAEFAEWRSASRRAA